MEKFNEWLQLKGYSTSSIASIIKAVGYFLQWMEKENIGDAAEVTHNDIIGYIQQYNQKGTTKKTIALNVIHLKKYFNWLITEKQISDNPCSNIAVKGIKRKVLHEQLSREELNALYEQYTTDITLTKTSAMKNMPPMNVQQLARKRNKVILGLIVYQALRTEELMKLQLTDVKLREGKIFIAGARRSNERTLTLESHQVFELLDYINDTRKQILQHRGIVHQRQELFLQLGEGVNKNNLFGTLLMHVKKMNSKIKTLEQLRASVITQWIKLYNLRKVQVMAGHRYISSTESYKAGDLENLKQDILNYHPF